MRNRTKLIYTGVFSFILILLSGCGMFQGEQSLEEMDNPPEEASYTEDLDDLLDQAEEAEGTGESEGSEESDEDSEATETVERELYLIDANGMVVSQKLELPKEASQQVATQALEYLVKDGPVTEFLPNGFEAVLPAGTNILGLNLKDGVLTVDVSEEFKEYRPEDEQKIIQSMTYTLTQFDNVEKVKLWINGYEQDEMPVNGTPLSDGYTRANGINLHHEDGVDLMNSEPVTLYYPAQTSDQFYFVPVTQKIEMENGNEYESIVQALINGPSFDLNLLNVFNSGATLTDAPKYEDGVLTLQFNENILNNVEDASISDEVMETLVLTLTEQPGVEAATVTVDEFEEVYNENGVPYSEPVGRDTFVPKESL